ncbi:protein zerknuellt 2-like isoform X2 [Onthophagus taurus]|uniref:protein zerknuellt 2-like isoform X2 n=1 Tax=Onthophagus taurus TaxID=166361 RepID=UPI0039BEA651
MENNLIESSIQPLTHSENINIYPLNEDSSYLELKSGQGYTMVYNPSFQPRVVDYNDLQFYYPNEPYFVNYPIIEEAKPEDKTFTRREKLKRKRTKFTVDQQIILEEAFLEHDYIPKLKRMQLAKTLGLPDVQIKIWFQNRRCKNKKGKNPKKTVNHNQEMLLQSQEFISNINNNTNTNEYKSINFNESLNFSQNSIIYPGFF